MTSNDKSFLTFMLNDELFAISVQKVLEIIETSDEQKITSLPKAPETIQGVVNFRGSVVPIVNTRMKFNMPIYNEDSKYVIMVLKLTMNDTEHIIGAMSDKVVDVIEIDLDEVQPVPEVGKGINSDFITGVLHRDNKFIMLLDFEKAIDSSEIIQLKSETPIEEELEVTEETKE